MGIFPADTTFLTGKLAVDSYVALSDHSLDKPGNAAAIERVLAARDDEIWLNNSHDLAPFNARSASWFNSPFLSSLLLGRMQAGVNNLGN